MSDLDRHLFRALGHPLRTQVLRLLEEGPSGPARLSARLGKPLGHLSYHMGVLRDLGCIELHETIQRRGALEHIYKLKLGGLRGSGAWRDLPPSLRTDYAGSALAGFTSRAIEALDAGTAESREGSGITWLPLNVDERGWNEMRRVLGNVEERFRGVAERSADRMKSSEDGVPVIVAVAAFEIGSGEDSGAG